MPEKLFTSSIGQRGNIKELLAFAPLHLAHANNHTVLVQAGEMYKSSSNVMYSPSGSYRYQNYVNSVILDGTNTDVYYLGAGPLAYTNENSAGGWLGSSQTLYSNSFHNPLFWMYTNDDTFGRRREYLYYMTFQSRSINPSNGDATTGSFPDYQRLLTNVSINPTSSFLLPPTNAPSYNYQLSASSNAIQSTDSDPTTIKNWTVIKDSLRSGSLDTDITQNRGNFVSQSGFYFFVRNNFPGYDMTNITAFPLEYTYSVELSRPKFENYTAYSFRITSASLNSSSPPPGQTSPFTSSIVFISRSLGTTNINGPLFTSVTISGTLDISRTGSVRLNNIQTRFELTDTSSFAADSNHGIVFQVVGYDGGIRNSSLVLKQSSTGKQIFGSIPIKVYPEPENEFPGVEATLFDTGGYFVVTPYLNFENFDLGPTSHAFPSFPLNDTTLQPLGKPGTDSITQYDFRFAVYYFKTAYALWRDAWRCTMNNKAGVNSIQTLATQLEWINATSCPSWAASQSVNYLTANGKAIRNGGWLYASRSAADDFIDYGTSSTDAAVRNRSYVGITAEILGGSEILYQLKSKYYPNNEINDVSASNYFQGLKLTAGGAIVVKASNVHFSTNLYSNRNIPSTYPAAGAVPTYIYYMPGIGSSSNAFDIPDADRKIAAVGLPITVVNNCDVVPLSNWNWSDSFSPFALYFPTDIPTWPYTASAGFSVDNYYSASDVLYGYDGYTF
jgi:hypothetical protein